MVNCFTHSAPDSAIPIVPIPRDAFSGWLDQQRPALRNWVNTSGFKGSGHCLVPDENGTLGMVIVGVKSPRYLWVFARLPRLLPPGRYRIESDWSAQTLSMAITGWGLGSYRFSRYKKPPEDWPQLVLPEVAGIEHVLNTVAAVALVRDLINTPAAEMMPENLGQVMSELAEQQGATVAQIQGDELLAENFPVIHAVGRASQHVPRLIDLRWGKVSAPRVTLVGKGVCFDSGGLDLKPADNMRLMKKDMGGAAHVIALARMIMAANLPVRLRVLVPAVENAVSGSSFRPGDVIRSRKGLSIEVENTDAEGRLILSDALAEACAEKPELLLDFATLTGAARVAVGTEVAAFFATRDETAAALMNAAASEFDPIWRLPLHRPYRAQLQSQVADIMNASAERYGGAITAALFLSEFVDRETDWIHFDIMGWNLRARPGRPKGGEAMGLRAAFRYITERFGGAAA